MKETQGKNGGTLKSYETGDKRPANAGRKKGTPNAKTRLDKLMQLSHTKLNPITNIEEKADIAFFVDVALLKKALDGDVMAYREVCNRMEGAPIQGIRSVDKDDNDITPINIHLFTKEELLAHLNDK